MNDARDRSAYLLLGRLGYLVKAFAENPEGIHREVLVKLATEAGKEYDDFVAAGAVLLRRP